MWHVSISAQRKRRFLDDEARLLRLAVAELRGVGGDHEWWIMRRDVGPQGVSIVGHLRVPVTPTEAHLIPPGLAEFDAGDTGPERPRTP